MMIFNMQSGLLRMRFKYEQRTHIQESSIYYTQYQKAFFQLMNDELWSMGGVLCSEQYIKDIRGE